MNNERIARHNPTEQIVGDITYGAFANPRMSSVLKQFGRVAFGRSSACGEFEAFLKRIKARGKLCVEIGTMHGITAILLSQFFDQVVCVSIDDHRTTAFKQDIVHYLNIHNITFHDVASNKEKFTVLKATKFDFAYVDGDHERDTHEDFALVKHCGRVLFHEYWPLQPAVWNLVNSFPQDEVTRAEYDNFAYWEKKNA